MIVRGRDFNDIYDLVGVRILVDSIRECYAVLGTIHARWSPVPGRFKDFIAMPKFNVYQSLHTTVIGPEGKVVEVQIRPTTWTNLRSWASPHAGCISRASRTRRTGRVRMVTSTAGLAARDRRSR